MRVNLVFSPRPVALPVRRVFAAGGAEFRKSLDKHGPQGIAALVDQRYGDENDMLLGAG